MQQGVYLKFFTLENARHGHKLLYEWLVDVALELELPGCSVFRSIAGYGHHHKRHSQNFLELQGTLPLEVVFAMTETQADALVERLRQEQVNLFHIRVPARFGFIGDAELP